MTARSTYRSNLPRLGHGIGLRRSFFGHIETWSEPTLPVDWLEVIPENYLLFGGEPRRVLHAVGERWPVVMHGVSLNLGGPDALDRDYLRRLGALAREIDTPWLSDHLCWSSAHGAHYHDLLPLPYTEEAVRHVAARVRQTMDAVERPVLVENVSTYAQIPGGTMDEADFVRAVVEEADCGLLLDVTNVVVNGHNHGFDPYDYIARVPLDRVVQIHLAGHRVEGDLRIDDHGSAVPDEVWALFAHVVERMGPVTTLVEWDNNIPPLDVVLAEAAQAREVEARALVETRWRKTA